MRVYSLTNQKGGVGKTTSCINMGAGLSLTGSRVLLVDLDSQCNMTTGLGFRLQNDEPSIYHVLSSYADADTETIPLSEIIISRPLEVDISGRGPFSLDIAPASPHLARLDIELSTAVSRETILKDVLATVDGEYDYVLLDCPPAPGLSTANAMAASHQLIIPVEAEFFSLEGMGQVLRALKQIRRINPDLSIAGVLVTKYLSNLNLSQDVEKALTERFADQLFDTRIRKNVRISEAQSGGKTIFEYDAESHGSVDYANVVQELVKREMAHV